MLIVGVGCDSSVGMATGYGLNGPGIESWWGARFSSPVQTDPGVHPAPSTMGTGCFPGVKSGRVVTLTPHPLLVPWSRKSRAIPLLPLWAVRPVQSLRACTRLHFTLFTTVGSIFFCGASKPWCVMPLKEFLVTKVKVTVQVPKDTVPSLHSWLDLVSNLLPQT